jgi:hypothetical protein
MNDRAMKNSIATATGRNPRHLNCGLVLRPAPEPHFLGLYCAEHNHWYMWCSPDQSEWLIAQGVRVIMNPKERKR